MISEAFLQYIWKNRLFEQLQTTQNGSNIEIISTGIHNTDSGPDFFNAKIKIGDTIWCGNVEIHIKTSDWLKHKHNNDKAYNNVILHVVFEDDKDIKNPDIETLVLEFDKKYINNFQNLCNTTNEIHCYKQIAEIEKLQIDFWIERLIIERLEKKTIKIFEYLLHSKNDWHSVFYILLGKAMGMKTNAAAFELLFESFHFNVIRKERNNITRLEALLFGQAGFLKNENSSDYYYTKLRKEYTLLQIKHNLKPINIAIWKLSKIRPCNFPTTRISQIAKLISKDPFLPSKILTTEPIDELSKLFDISASEYWINHFSFLKPSKTKTEKHIGNDMNLSILINAVVPFIFAYGKYRNDFILQDKAFDFLLKISSEKNNIVSKFHSVGVKSNNAFISQGLIELYNNYCTQKRCTECTIGALIIKNNCN